MNWSLLILAIDCISVYILTFYIVLRCIGIPARPVTNFESAHDANLNRAIDFYYDVNDEVVEEKSGDSIWLVM